MSIIKKERPLLMCGEMVRATLADLKKHTRRVMMPQPPAWAYCATFAATGWGMTKAEQRKDWLFNDAWAHEAWTTRCPYGQPGDLLWVREAWAKHTEIEACTCYKADPGHAHDELIWRPSIHMPRNRCRLTLEIVRVRVERVQSISDKDAIAEGIEECHVDTGNKVRTWRDYSMREFDPFEGWNSPMASFSTLWNTLNVKRGFGWEQNPWVWVVEFKREVAA